MAAPITSIKNQYRGINAHLNSNLQQPEGEWQEFHMQHITAIQNQLNSQLLGTGYVARLENGLQIRQIDKPPSRPESDVLIWDTRPSRQGTFTVSHLAFSLKPLNTAVLLNDYETYFKSVMIYKINLPDESKMPVAWIELLSPSNKKGGSHHAEYLRKRMVLLQTKTFSFVEIDYLHKSSPTIPGLPDYSKHETASMPYRVSMIDTRHGIETGEAYTQEFGIDETIPLIRIPLYGSDIIAFDLRAAYNTTYQQAFYGVTPDTQVNYRELPPGFETYMSDDRIKIVRRMLTVIDAVQNGVDLETLSKPLPINPERIQQLLPDENIDLAAIDFSRF